MLTDIAVIVEKPNRDDLFYTYNDETHNVKGRQDIDIKGLTNLKQLGNATLSVRVSNTKMQYMFSHKLSANSKGKVLNQSGVNSDYHQITLK